MNCQDYLTFHYLNFSRDSLLLKILLILTIAQDLQIFRKRPCGNQVNTVYTNGICCVKLFPAWQPPCNWRCDALLWVWRIIKNHVWVQCKSLCLPQGHGERRLTPAPSLASEPSQVHGPDGCLSSIANPPAPTKPKTFIAHGRIRMAERLLCFEWIRFSRHPLSPAWCFVSVVKECRKATKIMTDKYLCQLETVCVLHSGSSLWGKMQGVLSVDTVCRASGRISSISVRSVATPVPRVAASGRAALAPDEVVAWPLSPPDSSLVSGCSVLICVAVLKVCLCSHHSLHELVLSLEEARGLFITSVRPKAGQIRAPRPLTKSMSLENAILWCRR